MSLKDGATLSTNLKDFQPILYDLRKVIKDEDNKKTQLNKEDLLSILGNEIYGAPETINEQLFSLKSDVYSLGIIFISYLLIKDPSAFVYFSNQFKQPNTIYIDKNFIQKKFPKKLFYVLN